MPEVSINKNFIKEYSIKNTEYIEIFNKHPGIIKIPHFEKNGFHPAAGERVILQVKQVDASGTITGLVKKKKKERTPGTNRCGFFRCRLSWKLGICIYK
ncbi:MAG: hypothetical protein JSV56_09705 [Methanomassiliicoccales archaeon]|nr:MAG: hypothetical protein JSV56_09705 [Methanomassiliicoccales archaeon]